EEHQRHLRERQEAGRAAAHPAVRQRLHRRFHPQRRAARSRGGGARRRRRRPGRRPRGHRGGGPGLHRRGGHPPRRPPRATGKRRREANPRAGAAAHLAGRGHHSFAAPTDLPAGSAAAGGRLEMSLADATVSEIMVNAPSEVYWARAGRLERAQKGFSSPRALLGAIERIVAPLGRHVDESSPFVDARLPDGSRVNAIIPPLALKGPALTIRKFKRDLFTAGDLVERGAMTDAMAEFLETCVKARRNLVVSGGTGSGKTTLLNVLSGYIPPGERIVTIEDAAELQLSQDHWVQLRARAPNLAGKGAVTIRDLVRNTLRMRPDRIDVGQW